MSDYLDNLKDLSKLPSKQLKKYIRKEAISNTKKNLIDHGKDLKEIPWEELQELVAAEEKKVISHMKSKGLIATTGILALNLLNPISIAKNLFFDTDEDFDDDELDEEINQAETNTDDQELTEAEEAHLEENADSSSKEARIAGTRKTTTIINTSEETLIADINQNDNEKI